MSESDDSWTDDSSSSNSFDDSDFSDSVSLKYYPLRSKRRSNEVKKKYLQFKRANGDNATLGVARAVPEERAKLLNEKQELLDALSDAEDAQPSKMVTANMDTSHSSSTIPTVIVEEVLPFESSQASGSLSAFHGTGMSLSQISNSNSGQAAAASSFLKVPEFKSTYGSIAQGSCDIANLRATRQIKPSQQRKKEIKEDTGLTQNYSDKIVGQSSHETKHVETMPEQAKKNDDNDTANNRQN